MVEYFIDFLSRIIAVAIVISFHEFAHAFIAVKCGDNTPKIFNRLSLNPINHFDLFGFLSMILIGFGWAKPVPINPDNFKNRHKGILLVSLAGVIINIIFAFFAYPIFLLLIKYLPNVLLFDELLKQTFYWIYLLNLTFAIFNLIPVYPLDGFNVLFSIFKSRGKVYYFLRTKGYIILLVLIGVSFISSYISSFIPFFSYLDIFGLFMEFTKNILSYPITKLWNFIIL